MGSNALKNIFFTLVRRGGPVMACPFGNMAGSGFPEMSVRLPILGVREKVWGKRMHHERRSEKRHAIGMNQKHSSLITFSSKYQSICGLSGDECFLTHHHFSPVSHRSCIIPVTFPAVVFVITSLVMIITSLVIIISRLETRCGARCIP